MTCFNGLFDLISSFVKTKEEAIEFSKEIGYPLLIRSSFALGGLGSGFANNEKEMMEYEKKIYDKTKESEAVRKKYISNSLVIDKIKDLVNL